MRPLGAYYSLPSETNKYTHVFLATAVVQTGPARGDTEIEKYFDMSVVLVPAAEALRGIGTIITSMETIGALMPSATNSRDDLRRAATPTSFYGPSIYLAFTHERPGRPTPGLEATRK